MTTKAPKVLVPPINFSLVSRGVYRSGHPNRKNFPFLQGLSLKTIIYLESTTYRPDSQSFVDTSFISLHTYDISDESKLFTTEGQKTVEDVLRLVLDTRNHPLLIHDDMGKSVVSLICALVRRMERWSLTGIFAEGDMFAGQAGGSEGSGIGEAGREVGRHLRRTDLS
jgi:tyrosine-protein phosphatase SIW14